MNRRTIAVLGALSTLLVSGTASASGFFLYEFSPRSVAQGGATTAEGEEPATVVWNPAAMTRLEGFQAQLNVYTYINFNTHESPNGLKEKANTGVFPIPAPFVTYKPTEWFAAGVGSYSMWGLSVTWPDRWSGYHITKTASLRSYQVQPSIAFGPFEGLSVGGGLNVVFGSVKLSRGLALGSNQWGFTELGGTTTALGGVFALHYEPTDWIRLGATYRNKMKASLDPGKADFQVPPVFDQQFRDQQVTTSLNIPAIWQFGVRVLPTDDLEIEFDAFLLEWSSYDALVFQFEDPALEQIQPQDWHNAVELRLGAQYEIDELYLRAGFMFDQTPVPDETLDPTLPDNHRLISSVGVGYDFLDDDLHAALAYQNVILMPREVTAQQNKFPGKYTGMVHTIIVGANMKF